MKAEEHTVIIVGAGLTGIAASCYLTKHGIDHLILEKDESVGGVWTTLTWPGIRCDTEILNYSYSFKPFLSQHYLVPGEEISRYLHLVAKEFGVLDKTLFRTKVLMAEFRTTERRWYVNTENGTFKSKFLINANGYFSDEPYTPLFEGVEDFAGELIHLFHLGKDAKFENRRVVVVGSGASAISAAPALSERARAVTLLQRSPSYIYEQCNEIGSLVDAAQRLYRLGSRQPVRLVNFLIQLKYDLVFVLFRTFPFIGKSFFKYHWRNLFHDKTHREALRPRYNPWEQRIPVALGLKEGIRKGRIDIVTGRIRRFTTSGILLLDGRHIDADSCILATGFNLEFFRFPLYIDGQVVLTAGINYYKGMMMGGIPNYFQPFGPPHTSFTRRVERVCELIARIVSYMECCALDTVRIPRRLVGKKPRITPGYVMRRLAQLPVIYGTFQLPSIDNWLFFRFRVRDYEFTRQPSPSSVEVRAGSTVKDAHGGARPRASARGADEFGSPGAT